ncbi:TonB1 energy transduction system for heme uptake energy transducer component TonB [Shewanella sp. c952]|uniref:energy transducer TonB n=1 Tax=Shewanella sp. c952 TaxID=2815913 RepID=UPI001BB8508A|nr:energy transducer TonB [Shewanella sp. c952]GIU08854.1 TonB1 energy transduction system for heme uptake energy transducer component TonB [Shewanella sp. c952]
MTPKRYFAFGCITLLIQGGVLASQNTAPSLQLDAGSAMGTQQAVNLSIAMQASQAPASNVAEPEPVKDIAPPKPVKAKAVEPAPAELKPVVETKPNTVATAAEKPTTSHKPKAEAVAKQTETPEPVKALATDDSRTEIAHNQNQVSAKQGVSQESVQLNQPTFATPPAQPHYPKKARKRGLQGTATIEVMFNQLGEQLSLTLIDSSGYRLLDKAALNAVEKWQFSAPSPQTAYAYTVRVPVKFQLN